MRAYIDFQLKNPIMWDVSSFLWKKKNELKRKTYMKFLDADIFWLWVLSLQLISLQH